MCVQSPEGCCPGHCPVRWRQAHIHASPSRVPLPAGGSDPHSTAWGQLAVGLRVTPPPPQRTALASAAVGPGAQPGHLGVSHGCPMSRDPERWPLPTPSHVLLGPGVSMRKAYLLVRLKCPCRGPGWGAGDQQGALERRSHPGEGWGPCGPHSLLLPSRGLQQPLGDGPG